LFVALARSLARSHRSKNALDLLREVGSPSIRSTLLTPRAGGAFPAGAAGAAGGSVSPHFVLLSAVCVKKPTLELQRAKLGKIMQG
jgi:hypothetical protein